MSKFVPMPFSPEMMRANLDGLKSQTRRVIRLPDHPAIADWVMDSEYRVAARAHSEKVAQQYVTTFPHGRVRAKAKPGDVLWFREAWDFRSWTSPGHDQGVRIVYWADGEQRDFDAPPNWNPTIYNVDRARPPMHMPAWACRMWAVVKSVRCERLNDITEADAIAESFKDRAEFLASFAKRNEHRAITENPWVFVYGYEVTREAPEGLAAYLNELAAKRSRRGAR